MAPAPGEAAAAAERTAALEAEVPTSRTGCSRTLAEMENLRRRTEREIADARQYAVASFARDMLTVADNLRRAIDAVPAGARDGSDPALAALIDGVEVTERGLEQTLRSSASARSRPRARSSTRPSIRRCTRSRPTTLPAGTVVEVIQAGYVIGDRVLRPALVAIAKGGPAPAGRQRHVQDRAGRHPPG